MSEATYYESGYIDAGYFETQVDSGAINITGAFTPSADVIIADTTGYYIPDYIAQDYYAAPISEAQADITAQAAVTATAGTIKVANSTVTAQFSQSASGSRDRDIDLVAFSNGALSSSFARLRDYNSSLESVYTIATDFQRERDAGGDFASAVTTLTDAKRNRATDLDTQVAFSFDATVTNIKQFDSDITANTNATITASKFVDADADIASSFSITADNTRTRFYESNINAVISVTANGNNQAGAELTAFDDVNLECTAFITTDITETLANSFVLDLNAGLFLQTNFNSLIFSQILCVTERRDDNLYFNANNNVTFNNEGAVISPNGVIISTTNSSEEWISVPYDGQDGFTFTITLNIKLASARHSPGIVIQSGQSTGSGEHYWQVIIDDVGNGKKITYDSNTYHPPFEWYVYDTEVDFTQNTTLRFATSRPEGFTLRQLSLRVNNDLQSPSYRRYDGEDSDSWDTQSDPRISFINTSASNIVLSSFYFFKNISGDNYSDGLRRVIDLEFANTQLLNDGGFDFQAPTRDFSGSGNFTSISNINAVAGITVDAEADLNAEFTVSKALMGTVESIFLEAFSNNSLLADINKIRQFDANIQSEFSQSSDAERNRDTQISAIANATMSATATRIHPGVIETESIAIQVVATVRLPGIIADIEGSFTTDAEYFNEDYLQDGYFVKSITANVTTDIEQELNSVFAVSADTAILVDIQQELLASSSVSADAAKQTDVISNQNSIFSLSAQESVTRATGSFIDVVSIVEAAVNKDTDIDLTLFDAVTLTAQTDLFKAFDSDIQSEFTLFADTQDSLNLGFEADITTQFNTTADTDRIRNSGADIDGAANFIAAIAGTKVGDIDSIVTATFTADVDRTRTTGSNITESVSLSSIIGVVKPLEADITDAADFTASAVASLNGEIDIASQSTITLSVNVTRLFEADIDSALVFDSTVVATKVGDIEPLVFASVDAQADRLRGVDADITANTDVEAIVGVVKPLEATIASAGQFAVSARVTLNGLIVSESVSSITADNGRIRGFEADITDAADFTAFAVATRVGEIATTAFAFVNTQGTRVRTTSANQNVVATLTGLAGVRADASADITDAATFVTSVRDLRLDEIIYVIPAENRIYRINGETRLFSINGETRITTIQED